MSVSLKPELSLSADVSVTISQFREDLSKLVNFHKDIMFMFFFGVLTVTGVLALITVIDLLFELT